MTRSLRLATLALARSLAAQRDHTNAARLFALCGISYAPKAERIAMVVFI